MTLDTNLSYDLAFAATVCLPAVTFALVMACAIVAERVWRALHAATDRRQHEEAR